MADLSACRDSFLALHEQFTKLSARRYDQLRACGGSFFRFTVRSGRIAEMQCGSDLSVTAVSAEKKGNIWKSATDRSSDWSALTHWTTLSNRLLQSREKPSEKPGEKAKEKSGEKAEQKSADPRPPMASDVSDAGSEIGSWDPALSELHPAVIFHRTYQRLAEVFKAGFTADAEIVCTVGGHTWNGSPLFFAWNDPWRYSFEPRTDIAEDVCIYHPQMPHLRHFSRLGVSSAAHHIPDLSAHIQALSALRTSPLLRFSPINAAQIILMPRAASQLLSALIPFFSSDKNHPQSAPFLDFLQCHPSLQIVCDPYDSLFGFHHLFDAHGTPIHPLIFLENGRPTLRASSSAKPNHSGIGRALGEDGRAEAFAPILRGRETNDPPLTSAQAYAQTHSGSIVFVENLRITDLASPQPLVYFPNGGPIFENGSCLGYAIPPSHPVPLPVLLQNAHPIGAPLRTGLMAACALSLDTETIFSASDL